VAQQTDNPDPNQGQGPQEPQAKVQGEVPMFFKVLAASLAAGVDRTEQRAQKTVLAKQEREVAKVNRQRAKGNSQRKTRVPLLAAAAAILIVTTVMAARPHSDPLPDDLMGVWESTAEQYAERSFGLQHDQVTFEQGEGKFTTHPITGSAVIPDGESTLYVIKYDNGGTEYEFSFVHEPAEKLIRFKNQQQVKWYKR
jgi:hypothetical protein